LYGDRGGNFVCEALSGARVELLPAGASGVNV
jgi:hypothetical protein